MNVIINKLKVFVLSITMLLPVVKGYCQQCIWSSQAGGVNNDGATIVRNDKYGNTYIAGKTDYGCYFNTDTVIVGSFIAKYSVLGQEQWILSWSQGIGPNVGESGNLAFTLDSINDEIIAAGNFYGYLILPDDTLIGDENTIFLMKLDFDGNILWHKSAGGPGEDQINSVTLDHQKNIYISGTNEKEAYFGIDSVPRGGFLAKYNQNGELIWVKNKFRYYNNSVPGYILPFSEVVGYNIITKNDTLYLNGKLLNSTIRIDTATLLNKQGYSFLASFDSNANLHWIQAIGGLSASCGFEIATDKSSNIYITGSFEGTGIFGNDTLVSTGVFDCFLLKFAPNGNILWVKNSNSTSAAFGYGVAVSQDGVYFSGAFSGSGAFGDSVIYSFPSDEINMFLTKYSKDGINLGVRQYSVGKIYGLSIDGLNNISMVGIFDDTLSIGPNTFLSRGKNDIFIAKCYPTFEGLQPLPSKKNQLIIYANPNNGKCSIIIPDDLKNEKSLIITILDSNGKTIQRSTLLLDNDKISLNIQAEASGMYNVILSNGQKCYAGKIIFR